MIARGVLIVALLVAVGVRAPRVDTAGIRVTMQQCHTAAALERAFTRAAASGGRVRIACEGHGPFAIILARTLVAAGAVDVTIESSGNVVLGGDRSLQLIRLLGSARLTVLNLHLRHGGGHVRAGVVRGKGASDAQGGAVYVGRGTTLQLTDASVDASEIRATFPSPAQGGAICNAGTLVLLRSAFRDESVLGAAARTAQGTAALGGAIFNAGSLVVDGSSFEGNIAVGGAAVPGPPGVRAWAVRCTPRRGSGWRCAPAASPATKRAVARATQAPRAGRTRSFPALICLVVPGATAASAGAGRSTTPATRTPWPLPPITGLPAAAARAARSPTRQRWPWAQAP